MTLRELEKKLKAVCPGALEATEDGQLIWYTDLTEVKGNDELEEYICS